MNLRQEIEMAFEACASDGVRKEYEERLAEGNLARDENAHSHFCAYFVPYNSENQTLLIGNHKKSGLWLMPGGHIDVNEELLEAVNREIHEELGVKNFFAKRPDPFLLTVTNIMSDVRPCKKHFDVWHFLETDGADFVIDYTEYHEVRWVPIAEARELTIDPANLTALTALEKIQREKYDAW